ncbi:type II secretion system protein [Oricola sp.]|uniref:type II secretion system protein n=1 Tax=Oricola sp. TaxID=1979950 RepID=UPI0025DA9C81|nr:type II secretion system protein [Oricola sp.]MCI5075348.1 type II secretion system GspH family protein [Oricola sp.]
MTKHAADTTEGFTLLETLVAFLVLSIALATAIQSLSQTARMDANARLSEELRLTSRTLMAELVETARPQPRRDGVVDDRWAWSLTVETFGAAGHSNLLRYVLEVRALDRPSTGMTLIEVRSRDARSGR